MNENDGLYLQYLAEPAGLLSQSNVLLPEPGTAALLLGLAALLMRRRAA